LPDVDGKIDREGVVDGSGEREGSREGSLEMEGENEVLGSELMVGSNEG